MSDSFDFMVNEAAMNAEANKQQKEAAAPSSTDAASTSEKSYEQQQLDLEAEKLKLEREKFEYEKSQASQSTESDSDGDDKFDSKAAGAHFRDFGLETGESALVGKPLEVVEEKVIEHKIESTYERRAEARAQQQQQQLENMEQMAPALKDGVDAARLLSEINPEERSIGSIMGGI